MRTDMQRDDGVYLAFTPITSATAQAEAAVSGSEVVDAIGRLGR